MVQARAVMWAQWRSMRLSGGLSWSAAISSIWYLFWAGAAWIAMRIMEDPDRADIGRALSGALFLMFLYWQLVPLLLAASGASLDLRKLQAYPIPTPQLFGIELMLRITSAVEMTLLLVGISIGVARNPLLPWWSAFGAIPYFLFNLLLAMGLRDIVLRLMNRRRVREIMTILLVAAAIIPRFTLKRGQGFRFMRSLMEQGSAEGLPWTSAANLLHGNHAGASAVILTVWCAAMAAFAAWQFKRMLRFDLQAEQAGSGQGGGGLLEVVYRLPSRLLGDPMGVLLEKEIRYLTRSPRFRLVFLMGCTFVLIAARALGTQQAANTFLPDYLTGAAVYSLLLLGEVCFWNSFGFDRSAAQIYFLAPLEFPRVLLAKNLAALLFVGVEILISAGLCIVIQLPLSYMQVLDAFAVTMVVCLYLLSAGNLVSVRSAKPVNPQTSLRSNSPGRTQAFMFILYPVTFVPPALAYIARSMTESDVVFYAVLAAVAVAGCAFYKFAIDAATEHAQSTREQLIATLSQGEGPIAS